MYPHGRGRPRHWSQTLVAEVRKRPTITVLTGAEMVAKSGSFGNYQVDASGSAARAPGRSRSRSARSSWPPASTATSRRPASSATASTAWSRCRSSRSWWTRVDRTAGLARPAGAQRRLRLLRGQPQHRRRPAPTQYCSRFCCAATVQAAVQVVRARPDDPPVPPLPRHADVRQVRAAVHGGARAPARSSSSSPATPRRRWQRARRTGGLPVTVARPAHRSAGARHAGGPRRARDGHGPARERGAGGRPQAPGRHRRVLQRDPPEAPPGRDRRRRGPDRRRLPGPEDLRRERRLGARGGHAERRGAQEGVHGARPAGRRSSNPDACTACGDCLTACPYDAISMGEEGGRHVAVISPTGCKGCGGCVPMCPENAIDLLGYTDAQVTAMIDEPRGGAGLMATTNRDIREVIREEPVMRARILAALPGGTPHRSRDRRGDRRPDPRGRLLGDGHAPLRLARRDQGQHRGRLFPVRADREGVLMTAVNRHPGQPGPRPLPGPPALRRRRHQRLLLLRHLHRQLPAVADGLDVPAPDHPLRPAGHEGRAALQQGAVGCYQCGECAETCPTQADPSEFMAATRRYAIASYDRTRIARTMYTRPIVATVFAVVLAAFFAAVHVRGARAAERRIARHLRVHPRGADPQHRDRRDDRRVRRRPRRRRLDGPADRPPGGRRLGGRRRQPGRARRDRPGGVVRHRARVARPGPVPRRSATRTTAAVPWYRRRGLRPRDDGVGLPRACSRRPCLDYGLDLSASRRPGTPVPIWYPVRLLGTVAGLLLVYGVTVLIIDRYRAANSSVQRSTTADWMLLGLLWVTGVTGFVLELALYLPSAPAWGYWVFLRPRRGRDGARAPGAVHEARPRGVPARRPVLRRTRADAQAQRRPHDDPDAAAGRRHEPPRAAPRTT